ncbi:GGDEF domain-containing protein [Aquibium carbonis]|uniref:GGDEF domain-containing protein n=1 Tax=Aquibium carbonis TaxID=2495581 RepID=UPI001478F165|nr:GGDEF domain-containing protein [Aquibium carbonis]
MNVIRRKFLVRIMLTCFIGIHTPLIAAISLRMLTGGYFDWTMLGFILLATLAGTGMTLYVLQREIMPVVRISKALESFAERREIMVIDHVSDDEIGALARSASWAIDKADNLLRQKEHEAGTDSLTGLPNRRSFFELAQLHRGGSVAIIDLDDFKTINDTHGHHTGDYVLKTTASLIRGALRPTDCIARLGGEEFVVLLPDSTPEEALHVMERARKAVVGANVIDERTISFSAGVARRTGDIHADLARADRAMYHAKDGGRNKVVLSQDLTGRRRIDTPPLAAAQPDDEALSAGGGLRV